MRTSFETQLTKRLPGALGNAQVFKTENTYYVSNEMPVYILTINQYPFEICSQKLT